MNAAPQKIGLIAGWGRYPIVLAQALVQQGYHVSCLGIRGHADPELGTICQDYHVSSLTRMGEHVRFFRRHAIDTATFAGKVHKVKLFQRRFWKTHLPDLYCVRCFFHHFITGKKDRRDDTLLTAAVQGYARGGVRIIPATDLVPELLISPNPDHQVRLSKAEQRDIQFGWQLAKAMGRLDVGQAVAVKRQAVLAVEAVEGTDACIRRAGELCDSGDFVVVKVAKPQQDMRFDVPTIGVGTLQTMQAAGARVLAIEADKTILVDAEEVRQLARRYRISIVTIREGAVADRLVDDPLADAA